MCFHICQDYLSIFFLHIRGDSLNVPSYLLILICTQGAVYLCVTDSDDDDDDNDSNDDGDNDDDDDDRMNSSDPQRNSPRCD